MNICRILLGLKAAKKVGLIRVDPKEILISRTYPGKETVYAINAVYGVLHRGETIEKVAA